MEEKPNYFAIIPAEVRYNPNINANVKLLYGEISALSNKYGYCVATNEYFSSLYDVSTRTITDWIKALEDMTYITNDIEIKRYEDGTIKKIRKIYLNYVEDFQHRHIEESTQNHIEDSVQNHVEEKFSYNNTSNNNNTKNNKYIVEQVLDYLNEKTNSNYKKTTKSTTQKINARIKEGFSLEDFKTVIDKKTNDWKGTELEQYLRPDTLFGTKFESYLNQNIIKKQHKESRYEREKRLLEEMCNE